MVTMDSKMLVVQCLTDPNNAQCRSSRLLLRRRFILHSRSGS